MKFNKNAFVAVLASLAALTGTANAQDLIVNGGFETGFSGWTRVNQLGGDGTFEHQSGVVTPVNSFAVAAPRQGAFAAMTDSVGPGAHVLYQDFVVPISVPAAILRFSIFVNNGATAFSTPASLDWATPALNQQARVDITTTGADPFGVGAGDVLQNVYQTILGSALVTGYNDFTIDVTSLLSAHAGQTLRLRFAETDNVNFFNFGVDAVSLTVPAPSALALLGVGCLSAVRRRRS